MQRHTILKLITRSQSSFIPEVTEESAACKILFQHSFHHFLGVKFWKQEV